ncbi:MAG: DUF692 domain-containing protein [Kofleriaceae bacterium]|nr:DUF692 domain-containing protein [Kofleriaceae bacterium]
MREIQGVGIGLRKELFEPLLATRRRVDWLEIVSENYIAATGRAAAMLDRFNERWPVVPHGVGLSVGSDTPAGYLDGLTALVRHVAPPYISDHLCYSSIGARNYLDLLPLPRHAETVARVVRNARAAQAATSVPLILENITTYAEMPGSTLDESTFLASVAEQAGVGLLLDVNNLYVNAVNQKLDAMELLDQFPLRYVKQLHLAGHTWDGDLLLDTHAAPIAQPVWQLYIEVLKRCGPVPTLIEWDQHIPSLDAVLDQADQARDLMERYA